MGANCATVARRTSVPKKRLELGPKDIYRACDPATLGFATTADLPELGKTIGQARAVSSVHFGMGVDNEGYNIFAAGPTGTGKTTTLNDSLSREAKSRPTPDDWVYVHSFTTTHKPNAIRMPAGKGPAFRKEMEKLVEDLQAAITQAFEGEEYEKQKHAIVQQVSESQEGKLEKMGKQAEKTGFTMVRTPAGLAFAPTTPSGETMSREVYEALPQEQQAHVRSQAFGRRDHRALERCSRDRRIPQSIAR
jgi:hypothetical protein